MYNVPVGGLPGHPGHGVAQEHHDDTQYYGVDMRTSYIEASPILPLPWLSNPGLCVLHMCHWCWIVSAGQAAVWRDSV